MTPPNRQFTAGIVLLFGLVYLVFESVAAAAWVDPPYDWARNFISDLGFADCAVVDGNRLCSPLHPLMNAGLLVQGTVFTIGGLLVARVTLDTARQRMVIGILLATSGVGTFFVGVLHQSIALAAAGLDPLHLTAAVLSIGAGNAGILVLGVFVVGKTSWRGYGIANVALGAVGLTAGVLLRLGIDAGLGYGFIERIAVYPLNVWTVGSGVYLLAKSVRERRRPLSRSAPAVPFTPDRVVGALPQPAPPIRRAK
ncbi:DUF998 domain-containing protein [Cryobacterium fucosi]|uniref:DUF998 domain-containing protein n=1 Tax=Cryobacterium fucosi TaxID=1259157 RepID=A0A4R9B519_9MICO|nr:DUF998 domain-containing protein [Cryobacterium fucosi]TFD74781.1 DUF998 domain-containing protein [Cryobacterium fucosi]